MAILTAKGFISLVEQGKAVFLDINPPDLYHQGHAAGVYNVPFQAESWKDDVRRILKGQSLPIGLYADSHAVMETAVRVLDEESFDVIFTWDRGLKGWQEAQLPIDRQNG